MKNNAEKLIIARKAFEKILGINNGFSSSFECKEIAKEALKEMTNTLETIIEHGRSLDDMGNFIDPE